MNNRIIPSQSDYERLLEEIRIARARIVELTAERDDLKYHICPALQALYDEKIGSFERQLLAAQMYLQEKKRIIELLQAQANRREKPSFQKAEEQAHEEFRSYQEDLNKKAEEAEHFKNYWENETQWSRHDKEAREAREKRERAQRSEETQETAQAKESSQRQKTAQAAESIGLLTDGVTAETAGTSGEEEKSEQSEEKKEKTGTTEKDRTGTGQQEEAADDSAAGKEEDPVHELKRLYRQIVKRLHPDVNPNPTERQKELLNRANAAYKAGDLEEMRRIWEEVAGTDVHEEEFEDTEDGRRKLAELLAKLRRRCIALEKEIQIIKASFPYTMKSLLEDEDALEKKSEELRELLTEVRRLNETLDEYIAELKERIRKQEQG